MSLNRTVAIGVSALLAPAVAGAVTWGVDQGAPGCSDSGCSPCCTIQAAVGHSVGGDVVSVEPGTYPENIDFRGMSIVGDITLEAASGPGTVFVSPAAGHSIRHGDGYTFIVTIDGINVTSGAGSSCVYLDHAGAAVLRDVTATGCGYTAFLMDNTGSVTMRRCTATSSDRHGIQIDGSSGVYLEDCTTSSNTMDGTLIINVDGLVQLVDPTAENNGDHGLDFDIGGPLIISGATVADNAGRGIWAWSTDQVSIETSTVQNNGEVGIDLEWDGVDPVDQVTLTGVTVSGNGAVTTDAGVRLRDIAGSVTATASVFDNNGFDGFSAESSVVGDVVITGGHANGNDDDGYDLRNVGDVTVTGVQANGNAEKGFAVDSQAVVRFENCTADANANASGFAIDWQDPETVDQVTMIDCDADSNGLTGIGNGIYIRHVTGPVEVSGTTTNGNSGNGVRIDDLDGSALIAHVVSNSGFEEGVKIDADIGPVTIVDSSFDGNALDGIKITSETVELESMTIRRNRVTDNLGTGLALLGFGGTGTFAAICNDITGNDGGLYLDGNVTVDARRVWWGSDSGPSGQGPGGGDSVFAEPGGTISFTPWLNNSYTWRLSLCEIFATGFDSGSLLEWDDVVQ